MAELWVELLALTGASRLLHDWSPVQPPLPTPARLSRGSEWPAPRSSRLPFSALPYTSQSLTERAVLEGDGSGGLHLLCVLKYV